MKDKKILAIIPARGGSKGIPRKNIKLLAGKPLIYYTIEQSLNSELVNRTIVSTEDSEIAEISKKADTEVIIIPDELAIDEAPIEPVILHVLNVLKEKDNYEPDIVVLLQCTSPLRKKDNIDNAIKKLQYEKADSLLSVCPNHSFLWEIDKEKKSAVSINYDYKNRPRRQDKEWEYKENGAIYVTKTEIWKRYKNRLGGKIRLFVMDAENSLDIDTPFDFWLAEKILEKLKQPK